MEDDKKQPFKTLSIGGTKYKTLFTDKFTNRTKWEKPNDSVVSSVIPGKILKICVKEGQKVKAGEKVIVLEAMKMQNHVEVPYDAIVKKIHVSSGQNVPRGQVMVEFDYDMGKLVKEEQKEKKRLLAEQKKIIALEQKEKIKRAKTLKELKAKKAKDKKTNPAAS